MDGLFPLATVDEFHLSAPQISPLFSKYLENRLTGVLQVDSPPTGRLFFLFVQGTPINTYLLTTESRRKIQVAEAESLLGNVTAQAALLNLPLEGIRISKLLLETPPRGGSFQLQTRDLIQRIDGWSNSATSIAIQVQWEHAEAVMVFPGHDAPVHPMIFVKEGQTATELNALSAITSWNEPTCSVSILPQEDDTDAWKEYQLHLAFIKAAELVITQYNELAGRSLVSVLNQDVYDETLKKGWRISCIGNGMIDHHIFASPAEAAAAYRALFHLILAHMQTVVGPKISTAIVFDAIQSLDKSSQEIIHTYRLMMFPGDQGVSVEAGNER